MFCEGSSLWISAGYGKLILEDFVKILLFSVHPNEAGENTPSTKC